MMKRKRYWCWTLLLLFVSWCCVDILLSSISSQQSTKWFSRTISRKVSSIEYRSSVTIINKKDTNNGNLNRRTFSYANLIGSAVLQDDSRHRPTSAKQKHDNSTEFALDRRLPRRNTTKRIKIGAEADDSTSYNQSTNKNILVELSFPFLLQEYLWDPNGPGEMGRGVLTPENEIDKMKVEDNFKINQFNLWASDQIAINRTLPDVRPPRCKALTYPVHLPKTSVIIVFHNEAWSTLLRTLNSVVYRSPSHLLEEVILVDDASIQQGREWLGKPLEDYVSTLPVTVRVVRTGRRTGLVGARLLGVDASKGTVLTFLDSHCECTSGWLAPLLERIKKDRTRVVCPVIDSISDKTFEYLTLNGMAKIGGFSWFPDFVWRSVPRKERERLHGDINSPIRTPAMAGGLYSIHRDFFNHLGGYDSGMRIWGAENLALSFKVWQCGGSLEVIPCSHVGHVFRSKTPYSFPDDPRYTLLRNNKRVLEIWADDFKYFFYALTPAYRLVDHGNISEGRAMRKKLQCKSFQWYLDTVYPDHPLPLKYHTLGAIKNEGANLCLDVFAGHKDGQPGSMLSLGQCHGIGLGQVFSYNSQNQLQHDRLCLTYGGDNAFITLHTCEKDDKLNLSQRWKYNEKMQAFINGASGRCLDVKPSYYGSRQSYTTTTVCSGSVTQTWTKHNVTVDHTWFR